MSSPRKKQLEKRLGYLGFAMAEKAFLRKDPIRAERSGMRLGNLTFKVMKKRRNVALANLRLAFPEKTEEERLAIAQECFRHFGRIFADFLRSSQRTDEEMRQTTRLTDMRYFDEALKEGKGAILITGHFGNWERAAHAIVAAGYKVTVVARDANDGDLNQAVMKIREKQGIQVLSRGSAARGIFTKLKKNEIVAILPDQNSSDIFVPFFGRPCGTVTGPAAIHARTGAPIIPFFCKRVGPNQYDARAYPPLKPLEGYEPVEGMTRAINNAIEAAIRETPEQWLWFHDRWKSARKAGLL
ncbi:MAG TPA: lysophospholipid acyltransferase family protein [Fimbriimonadaceae bacterium]|nr:lysophospholipid acyltransferase family protein [Fimbriimonadaceae bacterium]